MLVWLYPEKQREELGAERWEVSWDEVSHEALKRNKETDSIDFDMDVDIVRFRRFYKTEAKAMEGARYWFKKRSDWLAFGTMTIQHQVVDWFVEEDRVAEWADSGEPSYVD